MEHQHRKRLGRWTGKAARVVAAGVIAFSLGGGATLVQYGTAHADDGVAGNVTIHRSVKQEAKTKTEKQGTHKSNHEGITYDAYRVFTGDVGKSSDAQGQHDVGNSKISNVQWRDEAMYDAVLPVIESWASDAGHGESAYSDPIKASGKTWAAATDDLKGESALMAAEYIANHIGAGDQIGYLEGKTQNAGNTNVGHPNQNKTLQLESDQFGSLLSGAIKQATKNGKLPVDQTGIAPDKTVQMSDGWYLFVTTPASVKDTEDGRTSTSPIFAIVGGEDVDIQEKDTLPTVDKLVKDDSRDLSDADKTTDADWTMSADANAHQDLLYKLVGTVANNIHSYDVYWYQFDDTVTNGMSINTTAADAAGNNSDAKVYLHKASFANDPSRDVNDRSIDVTDNFTRVVSKDGKNLKVTCKNLRKLKVPGGGTYAMVENDFLTVEYHAHIDPDDNAVDAGQATNGGLNVVQGETGNVNDVKIHYSNNPKTQELGDNGKPKTPDQPGDTGTSEKQDVQTYSYSLRLHKQDRQNAGRALKGAKFTLKVKDGEDKGSVGKYIQADGSLGDAAHEFVTDERGNILIKNLDAGTYELAETAAPPMDGADKNSDNPNDAYEKIDPATIVIGSNVHQTEKAHIDGKEAAGAYQMPNMSQYETVGQQLEMSSAVQYTTGFGHHSDVTATDAIDGSGNVSGDGIHVKATAQAAGVTGQNGADGNVSVVIREQKETQMPLTGGPGFALFGTIGAAVVAAGAWLLHRRRSKDAADAEA